MMRAMKTLGWTMAAVAAAGVSAVVLAQGAKPPVIATDITAADVQAVVKHPTAAATA